MKQNSAILRIVMMIVIAFGMQTTANAQLGKLKGLVKGAKEKVTNTVKNTVNNTVNNLAGDVTDQIVNENEGQPDLNLGELFPYDKKQFAGTGIYLDGTEKVENFVYYLYSKISEMLTGSEGLPRGAVVRAICPVCPDGRVVAYGEPVVNAFFYDYMQNPNDYKNYRQMIKGYVVAQAYYFGFLNQQMVEGTDDQCVDSENKKYSLWEKENDRKFRGYMLMKAAEELAANSDYTNIFDGTYSIMTQADKAYNEGKKEAAYNNYRELRIAYDNFLTQHPQWRQDNRAAQFGQMFEAAMNRQREIRDAVLDDLKEPQDMPKTYAAIPGIEGKIRQCIAAEDPAHKSAPIVFLSSGWRPLYKSGGNIIDRRAVDLGWTYTDAKGQKWLAYGAFTQKAVYEGLTVKYVDAYGFAGGFKTMKLK